MILQGRLKKNNKFTDNFSHTYYILKVPTCGKGLSAVKFSKEFLSYLKINKQTKLSYHKVKKEMINDRKKIKNTK